MNQRVSCLAPLFIDLHQEKQRTGPADFQSLSCFNSLYYRCLLRSQNSDFSLFNGKQSYMCFIYTVTWQELQLDGTYFQRGQRQGLGNIFQIMLTACSHVKLQELKATDKRGLLFARPAGPHGFIYIVTLGCDVGLRLKV